MLNTTAVLKDGSLLVTNNNKRFTINSMWFDGSSGDTMAMLAEALFNCYEYDTFEPNTMTMKEYKERHPLYNEFKKVFGNVDALWDHMEDLGYL